MEVDFYVFVRYSMEVSDFGVIEAVLDIVYEIIGHWSLSAMLGNTRYTGTQMGHVTIFGPQYTLNLVICM